MVKDKHLARDIIFVIVTPIAILLFLIVIYILVGWLSEISEKRYTERPQLSPAPAPYTNIGIIHTDTSGICSGDHIEDYYTVNESSEEIEKYYQNEMEKYCPATQGWQVTFGTMECMMPIFNNGVSVNAIKMDCRHSACVLKQEGASLHESFSVEVFRISSTETFVAQNHSISYLNDPPPSLVSYLFSTPQSSCGE